MVEKIKILEKPPQKLAEKHNEGKCPHFLEIHPSWGAINPWKNNSKPPWSENADVCLGGPLMCVCVWVQSKERDLEYLFFLICSAERANA